VQSGDPVEQTLLEFRRLDRGEDRIESIVRWNAIGEIQELGEPVFLRTTEMGNRHKVVRATDHRTHRDHDNVDQRIRHFSATRICQFRKRGQPGWGINRAAIDQAAGAIERYWILVKLDVDTIDYGE